MVDRIYDTLAEQFGEEAIFRDVDTIAPGVRYPAYIRECLDECSVALVFIGRDWLSVTDESGQHRLGNLDDPVRIEIGTALGLPYARVIPVLVRRAEMPRREQLPEPLRALCDCNSLTVRSAGPDYKQDVARLVAALAAAVAAASAARARSAQTAAGATPLSGAEWDQLLTAIAEEGVVPVLGPDMMIVHDEAAERLLPRWLGVRLADQLELAEPEPGDLRPLETTVRLALDREHTRAEVLFILRRMLKDRAPAPSASLLAVAALAGWRLFITSALDHLLETALLTARQVEAVPLHFSISEVADLSAPLASIGGAVVVHAAGTLVGSSFDAALTEADWRDFASAWRSPDLQPSRLLSELRRRRLLFLGGGHPRDFVALFLQLCRPPVPAAGWGGAWIGAAALGGEAVSRVLSGADAIHRVFTDVSGAAFVEELGLRWGEWVRVHSARAVATDSESAKTSLAAKSDVQPVFPSDLPRGVIEVADAQNPWIGLTAYTEEMNEFFQGRDRELGDLIELIEHGPTTVLYAASGLGKTSLLRAGLVPRLRRMGRLPVVLRLDFDREAPLCEQVLAAMVESQGVTKRPVVITDTPGSLWEFFHQAPKAVGEVVALRPGTVMIFDQFERLFIAAEESPEARAHTASFLHELADLCENRPPPALLAALDDGRVETTAYDFSAIPVQVVLSMRDDCLPALLPWAQHWPSLRRGLYRLESLTGEQALEVLAGQDSVIFEAGAAEQLIRQLTDSRSVVAGELREPLAYLRVPAPLLSLLALELNRRRLALRLDYVTNSMVTELHHGAVFADFYNRAMTDVPPAVRTWVEDCLVTPGGFRDSIAEDAALAQLPEGTGAGEWLDRLVARRLLLRSYNAGIIRLTLAHDLLVPVVQGARLQRQAEARNRWWRKLWRR